MNKKLFMYTNRVVLTNGSIVFIKSVKNKKLINLIIDNYDIDYIENLKKTNKPNSKTHKRISKFSIDLK